MSRSNAAVAFDFVGSGHETQHESDSATRTENRSPERATSALKAPIKPLAKARRQLAEFVRAELSGEKEPQSIAKAAGVTCGLAHRWFELESADHKPMPLAAVAFLPAEKRKRLYEEMERVAAAIDRGEGVERKDL